jgi:spore coat protein A
LVNGAPWPVLEVAAARYRFRLLNASSARRHRLGLDPARTPLVQIGSDGGLLQRPLEHTSVLLSPGERCEVVVDFSTLAHGAELTLRNALGSGRTGAVMRFRVTARATDDSRIPALHADVRLGEIEIWRFLSDLHHPVHVHLDPFQVLSRRGGDPGPHDAGWKDTVDLAACSS